MGPCARRFGLCSYYQLYIKPSILTDVEGAGLEPAYPAHGWPTRLPVRELAIQTAISCEYQFHHPSISALSSQTGQRIFENHFAFANESY